MANRAPDDWFSENIQPHESSLRAYLSRAFPSLRDVDDLIHDSYVRLLKAPKDAAVKYPKALLFTTARNLALDVFRRKQIVNEEAVASFGDSSVNTSEASTTDEVDRHEELEIVREALERLPKRCREMMILRYIHGLSYDEIAQRTGKSKHTVKAQLAKGLRKCSEHVERLDLYRHSHANDGRSAQ